MFSVSMPDGRPIFSTRCMMMNTAFATTASVRAICNPTRTTPVLLRSIALRLGRSSMRVSLLRLQILRGRDAANAPRRIEAREHTGGDCEAEGDQTHREIESRQRLVVLVDLAHAE